MHVHICGFIMDLNVVLRANIYVVSNSGNLHLRPGMVPKWENWAKKFYQIWQLHLKSEESIYKKLTELSCEHMLLTVLHVN